LIEPGYVRTMARYNSWQNKELMRILEPMGMDQLAQDRGAFFGSIWGTLNHVLWGDQLWMSRFEPSVSKPEVASIQESPHLTSNFGDWSARRFQLDGKILHWSLSLRALDLAEDLNWHSGAAGHAVTQPRALCIMHFFNHQTHHRGQIHTMLTAAGHDAPVSDLFLMPES